MTSDTDRNIFGVIFFAIWGIIFWFALKLLSINGDDNE